MTISNKINSAGPRFLTKDDLFNFLYKQYRMKLVAFLCRRFGSQLTIEDIVQDAFVRLYRKLIDPASEVGSSVEHCKGFLYIAALNLAHDVLRKEKTRRAREAKYVKNNSLDIFTVDCNRWHRIMVDAAEDCLPGAIDSLANPVDKTICHMFYFGNNSTRNIASSLGINQSTILTKISRSRSKMISSIQHNLAANGVFSFSSLLNCC